MSPRTWVERIGDILSCAKNIQEYSAGMTLEAFLDDPRTIRVVAFEFITMGEAAHAIPLEIQERYKDVPWGKMQGILMSEYFSQYWTNITLNFCRR